jgi:hypothetical protein
MPLSQSEYLSRSRRIRSLISDQLVGFWLGMGSYRDPDVDRFVRLAVPKVRAGQVATARATAAYLGGPVAAREAISGVRPVEGAVEYRRPAVRLYTELARGAAFGAAVSGAADLLANLVSTDMQLALRYQSQVSLSSQGVTKYRRVLSGFENCPRCAIAAQNVYSTADLLPIHGHCDCTVEPVTDGVPDFQLPPLDLTAERAAAVDGGASLESLIAVREHGELGPVITWASDQFTGPADIAA